MDLIISFVDVIKYDFGKVDEAMFEGVERPCEFIFRIPNIKKSALHEVV
jgi:hypothetical protein